MKTLDEFCLYSVKGHANSVSAGSLSENEGKKVASVHAGLAVSH